MSSGVPEASCRFAEGGGGNCHRADQERYVAEPGAPGSLAEGVVWASLCSVFLFFSVHPTADAAGAPHALADARRMRIADVDSKTCVISFEGLPAEDAAAKDDREREEERPAGPAKEPEKAKISVILLLPDGRWR